MQWLPRLLTQLLTGNKKGFDEVDFFLSKKIPLIMGLSDLLETKEEFNIEDYQKEKIIFEMLFDEVFEKVVVDLADFQLMTVNKAMESMWQLEGMDLFKYTTDAVDLTQSSSFAYRKLCVEESLKRYHNFKVAHIRQLAKLITNAHDGKFIYTNQIRSMAKTLNISTDRVYRILDSQVRKLEANIAAAKSIRAGVFYALWWTKQDKLVRPSHRALHGKLFDVRTGIPGEGLPGEPPNCRCRQKGASRWINQ